MKTIQSKAKGSAIRNVRRGIVSCFLVSATVLGLLAVYVPGSQSQGGTRSATALTRTLKIEAEGLSFTVRYPDRWSAAKEANMYKLLNVPTGQLGRLDVQARGKVTQMTIFTERRKDHAEAVRRLKEIEAEASSPSTFLNIGGWPALQRQHLQPRPQPGQGPPVEGSEGSTMILVITTAVAAEDLLVRLEGWLPSDAPPELTGEVKAIGQSLVFTTTGNPSQVEQEIQELFKSSMPRSSSPTPGAQTPGSSEGAEAVSADSAGASVRVTNQASRDSELEIAVSPNGQNIVIGSNSNYFFSTNGGQTWNNSAGIGGNDPSLGWGQSGGTNGTFYAANIASPSTAISVSINNGANFAFRANAYTCGQNGDPACGAAFPDQEHIAVDRFNVAAGGDQVYSAWRHLDGTWGIVCSANSGTTSSWSTNGFFTGGDFPRVTVGQDGFVYVVYLMGNNIMLSKFNSCQTNQNPMVKAIADQTVVAGSIPVACPTAGLDRCNFRNTLASPMVAVDDTNPNHVYVAYAVNTSPGVIPPGGSWPNCTNQNTCNERVVVQDSLDGGVTWNAANPNRTVTVSTGATARRFMPWVCTVGGVAQMTWYDRRAASPGGTTVSNNSLTDFFTASAFLNPTGNLTAGTEFQVNDPGTADAQCEAGFATGNVGSWPAPVDNRNDSESCSVQPQLGGICCIPAEIDGFGRCLNPTAASGQESCDFDMTACPLSPGGLAQTCAAQRGSPKYGDYNGSACAAGHLFAAWASATAPSGIPPSGSIDIFFAVEPPFSSDLSITKTDSPDPVTTGNNLTYTVTVTNNGPDIANTVTVTDKLPAETTFVSCSSTGGGVCGGSDNNRTVTFPSLASGESETITFVSTVNCSVADGTVISNTATVSSVTPDPDLSNNSATATTTASNPPPVITGAAADPAVLWPPNHRMVNVTVNYNVTDNCPLPPGSCTLSVTSNEPINGTGDGNTSPDWIVLDDHHVLLRAERAGNGNGRIYTITITCIDSGGNSSSEEVEVTVPHDRGRH
jgi:uncharacterized repeat protein (TIGR01451 family)